MKIKNTNVTKAIENAKQLLDTDKHISAATKTAFTLLITLISILINRITLNSKNSSKPPSTDEDKKPKKDKKKTKKKPGGQNGHKGRTLEPVSNPDEIKYINFDRSILPEGKSYQPDGYESRQVIDIKISSHIIEYRAEVLIDEEGAKYVASFPGTITRPIQYGSSVKSAAVYNSVYQLIPYERTQEQFRTEYNIPISTGSICNFRTEASNLIESLGIEKLIKHQLQRSPLAHADETSINLNGTKFWLHNMSNEKWTWFASHAKRGAKAMDDIGIIPSFSGILCHDHWKPYYLYNCTDSLCNAHHIRELTRAYEQDKQNWAKKMIAFLTDLNNEVNDTNKKRLIKKIRKRRRKEYRQILTEGNQECPEILPKLGMKRKPAQSKSRNLLLRLQTYYYIITLIPVHNLEFLE